mgnify:CR=1 FL=1
MNCPLHQHDFPSCLIYCLLSASVYSGCISTFVTVYTEDGLRKGLYRGLSINYMRVVPQVAVMFSVYEIIKQVLNDSTVNARSEWVLLQRSGTGIQKLHKALINNSKKERKLWAQEVIWVRKRDAIKYKILLKIYRRWMQKRRTK